MDASWHARAKRCRYHYRGPTWRGCAAWNRESRSGTATHCSSRSARRSRQHISKVFNSVSKRARSAKSEVIRHNSSWNSTERTEEGLAHTSTHCGTEGNRCCSRQARRQDRTESTDERDVGGHGLGTIQVVVRELRSCLCQG